LAAELLSVSIDGRLSADSGKKAPTNIFSAGINYPGLCQMGKPFAGVETRVEREVARILGYRLLGWAGISLWASAVLLAFRLVRDFPAPVASWLLWISPLMIVRGIAGVMIHRALGRDNFVAPPSSMVRRMSFLFAFSDGLLLLTAVIILARSGVMDIPGLVMMIITALGLILFIYLFVPGAALLASAVAVVPALLLCFQLGIELPVELVTVGVFMLTASSFGALRFRKLFIRQLRENISYKFQIDKAEESNYIFNQHWQCTPIAAIDWDRNLNIRSWNPAAEKLFGFSAGEALGQSLELIFAAEDAERIRNSWQQGEPVAVGKIIRTAYTSSQEVLNSEWYDTPLRLDGELIGVASYVLNRSGTTAVLNRSGATAAADGEGQLFDVAGN